MLDIIFEVVLNGQRHAEFLIRLETPMAEVRSLLNKLVRAIEHPMPHPWDANKFDRGGNREDGSGT